MSAVQVEKHDLRKYQAATLTLNLVSMKLFDINQMKLDDISWNLFSI